MSEEHPTIDLFQNLEEQYEPSHALDTQPAWMDDLADVHDAIETAFARRKGTTPDPMVELRVTNGVSGEDGWHRIEATESGWLFPFEHPPAGIVAALDWLEEHVPAAEYRQWHEEL